jgi:hypothetical protein
VYLANVHLEENLKQDVDPLVAYTSCPIPGLVALSKSAQQSEMRRIVSSGSKEEIEALCAHCSSVDDSLSMISVIKKASDG